MIIVYSVIIIELKSLSSSKKGTWRALVDDLLLLYPSGQRASVMGSMPRDSRLRVPGVEMRH